MCVQLASVYSLTTNVAGAINVLKCYIMHAAYPVCFVQLINQIVYHTSLVLAVYNVMSSRSE